jgi:hypothetical protein
MLAAYNAVGGKNYVYSDWVAYEPGKPPSEQQTLEYDQSIWPEKMQHAVTALVDTQLAREQGFDETLPTWEDWDFFLQFALKGYCGVRVPEPLLIYRVTSGTRRDVALKNSDRYRTQILTKYEGVKQMACGACGGGANTAQQIQTAVLWASEQQEQARPTAEPMAGF